MKSSNSITFHRFSLSSKAVNFSGDAQLSSIALLCCRIDLGQVGVVGDPRRRRRRCFPRRHVDLLHAASGRRRRPAAPAGRTRGTAAPAGSSGGGTAAADGERGGPGHRPVRSSRPAASRKELIMIFFSGVSAVGVQLHTTEHI